jgi:hypothetical protein
MPVAQGCRAVEAQVATGHNDAKIQVRGTAAMNPFLHYDPDDPYPESDGEPMAENTLQYD